MQVFGTLPDGRDVHLLRLGAAPGVELEVVTLGAAVHRLVVGCGDGVRRDVTLGYGTVAERLAGTSYLGATVGRYANRIAGGRLPLGEETFELSVNDRGNTLHGGADGFDLRLWEVVEHSDGVAVLRLPSPDGDQGFPGQVTATVRFEVDGDDVRITHEATTDAPTVVNLTNHAYLNLDGGGTIEDHLLTVHAEQYLPVDATDIPVDGFAPVAGTRFDLRGPSRLGDAVPIDHDLVVTGTGVRQVAVLSSPATGTRMELWTDQPGLQVYTGNVLDGGHPTYGGVALEPQLHPDSPHHPDWPSATLLPGEVYSSRLEWRFGFEARR